MNSRINDSIEGFLYRRGFHNEQARKLVRNQLYLLGLCVLIALASALAPWGWALAAGAAIMTLNFAALARVIPGLVYVKKGAVAPLLVQFYGRLLLTGLVLAALIAWVNAPVIPLMVGLSTVVVNALLWWAQQSFGQKVKEA